MNAKILIAEGDTAVRLGLVSVLEGEGYSVAAAGDEFQVVRLFGQQSFELLIVGSLTPSSTSFDVCGTVRAHDPHIPFLFLATEAEEFSETACPDLGEGDESLTRPVTSSVFLARVEAVLRRSRAVGSAALANREI